MEDNTTSISMVAMFFLFLLFITMNIVSCNKNEDQMKFEETKEFLNRGCEQILVPNTNTFYWGNCKVK